MPTESPEFAEALKTHRKRSIIPGAIPSNVWQAIAPEIKRRSMWSAQVINYDHLVRLKEVTDTILHPAPGDRVHESENGEPAVPVTEGLSYLTGRLKIQDYLDSIGHHPAESEKGTIKDLTSDARIKLQLRTNVETAQGYGNYVEGQDDDILFAFPAQELFRAEDRKEKRDWPARWLLAAQVAGDGPAMRMQVKHGRMIALKDSRIWEQLGTIADDSLGNPSPPFAFNSGMWVRDIGRAEAIDLELLKPDQVVAKRPLKGLNDELEFSTRTVDPGWAVTDALMEDLGPGWQRDEDNIIRRIA